MTKNLLAKVLAVPSLPAIKRFSKTMDYKSTGGAMLLGVNGVVVKAHGSSDGYGFSCAMNVAYNMASVHIVDLMKEGIKEDA